MSDKQNFQGEMASISNDLYCHVPSNTFPQEECSQATSTTCLPSTPVYEETSLFENSLFHQSQFPFMTFAGNEKTSEVPVNGKKAFINEETGDLLHFVATSRSPQKLSPEASGSRFLSSKPIEDAECMTDNSYFHQTSPFCPVIRCEKIMSYSEGTMNSLPVKTNSRFVATSETAMNADENSYREHLLLPISANESFVDDLSSCGLNIDKHFRNEFSSSDQIEYLSKPTEFLSSGRIENLQEDDSFLSNGGEDKLIENYISPSGDNEDQYMSNTTLFDVASQLLAISEGSNPLSQNSDFIHQKDDRILPNGREDKHGENDLSSSETCKEDYILNNTTTVLDIASKLLAISLENETQEGNTDFIDHLYPNDISSKYCQLYTKIIPENYDFAMNIMAYIEILNDCSWIATFTYFDQNVKIIVKHFWNEFKNTVNNNIELQQSNHIDFIKLMEDFSENTFGKTYTLNEFLQYCVIMCQLGVLARKRNFKEAPLYVIDFLRKGISKFENYFSIIFEIFIIKHAQELVKRCRM